MAFDITRRELTPSQQRAGIGAQLGTSAQNDAFTGHRGQITFDTDTGQLRYHDGVTKGGIRVNTTASDGWADYVDTQYTSSSPFAVAALTDTIIPNNASGGVTQEIPSGSGPWYNGSTGKWLTDRAGDGYAYTPEFKIDRQSGSGAFNIELWWDIGGSIPDLYRRTIGLRGSGEQNVTATTTVYTLDTWAANGGDLYIRSDVAINMYDIRFVIHKLHAGVGTYGS